MSGNVKGRLVRDGLLIYYDPANPSSYLSGSTSVTDISKNGKEGTLNNGVGFSDLVGGSFSFDGVDDYITVPSLGLLSDFTISSWFRITGAGTGVNAYATLIGIGSDNRILARTAGLSSVRQIYIDMATNGTLYNSDDLFTYNTWNNVTFTYNSTTDTGIIYLNNKKQTPFVNSTLRYTNSVHYIGTANVPLYEYSLLGNTSNFFIYNRALSDDEVTNNYNALRGRFGR